MTNKIIIENKTSNVIPFENIQNSNWDNGNNAWKILSALSALQQVLSKDVEQNVKISDTVSEIQMKMLHYSVKVLNMISAYVTNNDIDKMEKDNEALARAATIFNGIGGLLASAGMIPSPLSPILLPLGAISTIIGCGIQIGQGAQMIRFSQIQSNLARMATTANIFDAVSDNCGIVWNNSNDKLVNKMKTKDNLTAFNFDNIKQMGDTLKLINKKVS